MIWWLWVLAGIALLAFEVATPGGLFALFFGVGALLVAPLAALGVSETVQWFAFSVLSLVGLAHAARAAAAPALAPARRRRPSWSGEQAVLLADLPAGGEGKAELRGHAPGPHGPPRSSRSRPGSAAWWSGWTG